MKSLMICLLLAFSIQSTFCETCGTVLPSRDDKATVMADESGTYRVWKDVDRSQLTYCISNRFQELKPTIQKAMRIATEDWMSFGNISFIYVPQADATCDDRKGPETRFRIEINRSRRYRYAGMAFFPYDERKTITFKKSYVQGNFEKLLRLTRHELGHVLGLRHEHIREENPLSESCKERSPFRAVNSYDSDSVMHYSRCGGTGTTELSQGDKEGIAILYPNPNK